MIVVTTPTGQIGGRLAEHLVKAGERVRVIARDPDRLTPALRGRVEVVQGSHGDAAVVDRAFEGAEAVFWLAPPTPLANVEAATVEFARPAAAAIQRLGVPRVVAISNLGRGTTWQERAGTVTGNLHMVDLLCETGAAVRGLALPALMENALQQVAPIRGGNLFGPLDPDRKVPHVATRDVAAVAARLLADRDWTGQEDVAVLGPEDLSYDELAAIISEVTGRKVRYRQVPFDAFQAQAIESGMSEAFARGFVDMFRAKNEGMDNVAERTPEFAGPTTFHQWAEDELKPALAS